MEKNVKIRLEKDVKDTILCHDIFLEKGKMLNVTKNVKNGDVFTLIGDTVIYFQDDEFTIIG